MSHLFEHNGAVNTGYSQPTALVCETKPSVPSGLCLLYTSPSPRDPM